MRRKYFRRGGQGIIEYILLIAAVIVILLLFLGKGGVFEQAYNNVIRREGSDILNAARTLFD